MTYSSNHYHADLTYILDGLQYLEQNGLEHGKLNSSNILIDQTGTIKLCMLSHLALLPLTSNKVMEGDMNIHSSNPTGTETSEP